MPPRAGGSSAERWATTPPRRAARRSANRGAVATQGAELYSIATDFGETTNLAAQEPEKFKELAAAWDEWNKANIPAKWGPGGPKAGAPTSPKPAAGKRGKCGPAAPAPAPAVL